MASRVLWAALIAIWLLLAVLSPIGIREDYTTTFRFFDLYNGTRLKALLAEGLARQPNDPNAAGQLAGAMSEELRRKFDAIAEGEDIRIPVTLLTDGLNELIDEAGQGTADWYDAEAWAGTTRLRELRELDEKSDGQLDESLIRRRARLRIEAALPGVFEQRSSRSVSLTYAALDFPTGFEVDRSQFVRIFNQFVIPTLVHWLLGFVLVFLGVLVTASIIPDMLQTGSLHLLLSKPVSRPGLLIAKFVGGCAFVTLCVCQLVIGLYLISGFRLEIWNPRILWCIPVAVFLFAVFYSVSVPAGLRWRSPIIAIAAASALAAFCFVLGILGGVVSNRIVDPDRIRHAVLAGEDVIASTAGSLVIYDSSAQTWQPLIDGDAFDRDRILAPVVVDNDHLVTARIRGGRMSRFGAGSPDALVLTRQDGWAPTPTVRLPSATERLMTDGGGNVMALNTAGLTLAPAAEVLKPGGVKTDTADAWGGMLRGLMNLGGGATETFAAVLPVDVRVEPPVRLIPMGDGGDFVLRTGQRLIRLEPSGSLPWQVVGRAELQAIGPDDPVIQAAGPDRVLIAGAVDDSGQRTLWVHGSDKRSRLTVGVQSQSVDSSLTNLHWIAGDRYLLTYSDGTASIESLIDPTASIQAAPPVVLPIDDIQSVTPTTTPGQFLVAHHVDSLDLIDLTGESWVSVRQIRPRLSTWRWVDRYVLATIRWLTPQVLELGDTVSAAVSGQDSFVIDPGDGSGDADVVRLRIARPLISCGAFIIAMLTISCFYFSRGDF